MPTYYTPLTNGAAGNAAAWNTVLTQLDDQLVLMAAGSGFNNKSANLIFAGPSSGGAAAPSFRALVDNDIPNAITISGGTVNNSIIGGTTPAAGTFTSLSITVGAAQAQLQLSATAGNTRWILLQSGSNIRWAFGASNTAESGGNLGSDFFINRYDDAGSPIANVITIARNSGFVSFAAGIGIAGNLDHDGSNVGFYGTAPAAKPTVTGSRGGNAALASVLTALATLGLITNSSSA